MPAFRPRGDGNGQEEAVSACFLVPCTGGRVLVLWHGTQFLCLLLVSHWRATSNLGFMGTLGGQALKMALGCPPPGVHSPALSLPLAKGMGCTR